MKTYKLKTNAKCSGCTSRIDQALKNNPHSGSWQFDLQHPDRLLIITTELPMDEIIRIVAEAGYQAEPTI